MCYGISMNADLLRRSVGWISSGNPGNCCYLWAVLAFYHLYIIKNCFARCNPDHNYVWFIFGKSYGTIMESWKLFAYDNPKYAILALLFVFLFRKTSKGAEAYYA